MGDVIEKETAIFCQKPSAKYMKRLKEAGNDPRVLAGRMAIEESQQRQGGWVPTIDARESDDDLPGM